MIKNLIICVFVAAFIGRASAAPTVATIAVTAQPETADMTDVMQAIFLSRTGAHIQSAGLFAQLAEKLQSADLMREAYREAIGGANNPQQALNYARRWHTLGGQTPALQAQVHLFLTLQQNDNAEKLLLRLKHEHAQSDEEIFKLLRYANKQTALNWGRQLFEDTATGNLLLAQLALDGGDWAVADDAIRRGLSHSARQDELYLARMQLAAMRAQDFTAALPVITDYIRRNCPGFAVAAVAACAEAPIIYAYTLATADDDDWRRAFAAEATFDAALATGRFFEIAEMYTRAKPYYEKTKARFFEANLGLARIARESGNWQEALNILDNTAAANQTEFVLREITAADIVGRWLGAEKKYQRLEQARKTAPDNHDLIYQHALAADDAGDLNAAITILQHMIMLFPASADGWNALGYLLADHNLQLQTAEQYIRRALQINPDSANILDSLGWVYYRQGRLSEAQTVLLMAVKKSNSAEIWTHLGEVYWQLGEYEQARAIFSQARQNEPDNAVLLETVRRLQIDQ